MSRHNRRRTRGGHHSHSGSKTSIPSLVSTSSGSSMATTGWSLPPGLSYPSSSPGILLIPSHAYPPNPKQSRPRQHYPSVLNPTTYANWQILSRQASNNNKYTRAMSEKARMFDCTIAPGEDNDQAHGSDEEDEALREKMLEYFEGLNWAGL